MFGSSRSRLLNLERTIRNCSLCRLIDASFEDEVINLFSEEHHDASGKGASVTLIVDHVMPGALLNVLKRFHEQANCSPWFEVHRDLLRVDSYHHPAILPRQRNRTRPMGGLRVAFDGERSQAPTFDIVS